MQSSNAEQLLACQAQNQPKNSLSLPPPFVGGFLVAGSGTVPNPALELPLRRGLVVGGFRVCPRSRADSPRGRGLLSLAGDLSDRILLAHGLDFHSSSHLLATYPFLSASHPPTLWAFLNV